MPVTANQAAGCDRLCSARSRHWFHVEALAGGAEVVLITVPANGHQAVMDSLLPHLKDGQIVIVSSMSSLSSLYLFEQAKARGLNISVASFGTTALTARRKSPTLVNVMSRRGSVSVSALPQSSLQSALEVCDSLFGGVFLAEDNPLIWGRFRKRKKSYAKTRRTDVVA